MEFETQLEEMDSPDACATCSGAHDEDIHAATVRVRQWLRSEINRKLTIVQPELLQVA